MTAGGSAAETAAFHAGLAEELSRHATLAQSISANYAAAAFSERKLANALHPLRDHGYFILEDRRWPRSRTAQVDFVLVGPSGVVIVDAKSWRDVGLRRAGSETRIFRDQADVTDELSALADLADTTERTLADAGLPSSRVRTIAAFTNRSDVRGRVLSVEIMSDVDVVTSILRWPGQLDARQVESVFVALTQEFPPIDSVTPPAVIVKAPVLAATARNLEVLTVGEVSAALAAGMSASSIEGWMVFLHPDQARTVRRSYNGPCRIRGGAGTGKTVVGLHRAAYLAKTRPGRVLVTSYVKTLPAVFDTLMLELAPEVADKIDCSGVHAFAHRILRERNLRSRLDKDGAEQALAMTWRQKHLREPLDEIEPGLDYWRDEIAWVIKGRGLASLGSYLGCARVGRRRPLSPDLRAKVWDFYIEYERRLREADVWDFADLILHAEAALEHTPCTEYSAVVIDEAQDLSAAMVRMLHRLVGDAPDGLNLIGDGQQSIYPGGYTLGEIGINIAGRGVVMNRNYRNTAEIAEFAASLVSGDEFTDIEGTVGSADSAENNRRGGAPLVRVFDDADEHDEAVVDHVRGLLRAGVPAASIAILANAHQQIRSILPRLHAHTIRVVDLKDYDGSPIDAIKTGTIKRAKGLEFTHVVIARAPRNLTQQTERSTDRLAIEARQMFVAATRARDGLWVGVV